jgi:hypothetical protein
VPFLLKDLGALSEGDPYAEGVKAARTAGYRADHDSVITERFHAAGLVYIGRTNTPEFGLVPTTEGGGLRALPQPLGSRPIGRRVQRRLGRRDSQWMVPVAQLEQAPLDLSVGGRFPGRDKLFV